MPRVTLRKINEAIAARGGAETIVKGNGYFYFADGNAMSWPSSSVYTNHLSDLSLESWMREYEELRAAWTPSEPRTGNVIKLGGAR